MIVNVHFEEVNLVTLTEIINTVPTLKLPPKALSAPVILSYMAEMTGEVDEIENGEGKVEETVDDELWELEVGNIEDMNEDALHEGGGNRGYRLNSR
jgi:hypothetical protein